MIGRTYIDPFNIHGSSLPQRAMYSAVSLFVSVLTDPVIRRGVEDDHHFEKALCPLRERALLGGRTRMTAMPSLGGRSSVVSLAQLVTVPCRQLTSNEVFYSTQAWATGWKKRMPASTNV